MDLKRNKLKSRTQLFIDNYKQLQAQGALDEEKVFEASLNRTMEEVSKRGDLKPFSLPRERRRQPQNAREKIAQPQTPTAQVSVDDLL